ncbi:MAG: hypothetical protein IT371_03595 [Deltaproteobacteria bacterium]|nr:hypothetical protein [Deltaproteobacteria bacterium]
MRTRRWLVGVVLLAAGACNDSTTQKVCSAIDNQDLAKTILDEVSIDVGKLFEAAGKDDVPAQSCPAGGTATIDLAAGKASFSACKIGRVTLEGTITAGVVRSSGRTTVEASGTLKVSGLCEAPFTFSSYHLEQSSAGTCYRAVVSSWSLTGGTTACGGSPDAAVPRPDAGVPDAARPDAQIPDAVVPDTLKPDAPKPDQGVSPIGCADGTRDGLTDPVIYPAIAACSGTWTGDVSTAGSICAAGWHVCRGKEPAVKKVTYAAASAFAGCFAFDAAQDNGACYEGCSKAVTAGVDTAGNIDMAGMGSGCPYKFASGYASCLADGRIDSSENDGVGCNYDKRMTGVVCCKD